MTRPIVLGVLFAVGALSISVAAVQQAPGRGAQQPAARVVEVQKLRTTCS